MAGRRDHAAIATIHDAFVRGDMDALRQAVEDPELIPNGRMPVEIGCCLVYAIYHSPIAFVRTLLELGADSNQPVGDGFPPLIAALSGARAQAPARVADLIALLLAFGADPNQRGINDYTALHMAVAERQTEAVRLLIGAGADASQRTRIDACETPAEMARAAGLTNMAAVLDPDATMLPRRLRAGLVLLADIPGTGELVRRQHRYRIRLRMWLHDGTPVRLPSVTSAAATTDEGTTVDSEIWINRGSLIGGLFYGVEGMRVGGTRRLEIAPRLAYAERGVPGVIPPGATLIAEIMILET